MAKRPKTLETTILAIDLLRRIPAVRKVTAKELHAQLKNAGTHCTLRTVQRQLETLSQHFGVVRDETSKPYGYSWHNRAQGLALTSLTAQESLLLTLAKKHLKHLLPPRLMASMDDFFEQATRNLGPDSKAELEREWPSKVRVVAANQPLLPPQIKPGILETVSEALYANCWLNVDYRNRSGACKKAQHIMPLGLAQQGACLYLVCRFDGYSNERSLALHRILAAKTNGLKFERPADFSLAQYDADGRFGFGDGTYIRLQFCIEKEAGLHLLESKLSADQTVKELATTYEISATVIDCALLDRWLLGFGQDITKLRRSPLN